MTDNKKTTVNSEHEAKKKLHTEFPLSEKDEVKDAEHQTAKAAAKHAAAKNGDATNSGA